MSLENRVHDTSKKTPTHQHINTKNIGYKTISSNISQSEGGDCVDMVDQEIYLVLAMEGKPTKLSTTLGKVDVKGQATFEGGSGIMEYTPVPETHLK
jgi:hypothetical protein